jgi:hypothetical protein
MFHRGGMNRLMSSSIANHDRGKDSGGSSCEIGLAGGAWQLGKIQNVLYTRVLVFDVHQRNFRETFDLKDEYDKVC